MLVVGPIPFSTTDSLEFSQFVVVWSPHPVRAISKDTSKVSFSVPCNAM